MNALPQPQEFKTRSPEFMKEIQVIARKAMVDADSDPAKAAEAVYAALVAKNDLFQKWAHVLIQAQCAAICQGIMRSRRSSSFRAAKRVHEVAPIRAGLSPARRAAVQASRNAAMERASLLEAPLRPGLLMRDAHRSDILAKRDEYAASARTASERARYLSLVAERLPVGKTVGEVFSNLDLAAFAKTAAETDSG